MLLASLLSAAPALATPHPGPHGQVRITEFLAVNDGLLLDEDGDDSDWIEITNTGSAPVDLGGWSLTDSGADVTKWTFPSQVLAPGARLVVFASSKDRAVAGSELHTNFKLASAGELLALMDPSSAVASAYAPSYPAQSANVSFGLLEGTVEEGYLDPPTPGEANGDDFVPLPPVVFSHPRSVGDTSFSLALSHPDPAATLLFTTDGSDPSTGSAYTGPIPIVETTIVRATASKAAFGDAPPKTHSYIFPLDVLAQSQAGAIADGFHAQWVETDGTDWTLGGQRPGASYGLDPQVLGLYSPAELVAALESLPTVSLAMAEEDWFGDGSIGETPGIYCNSFDYGDFWDRAASAEWIDPSGGPEFQIDCGVAVQGGSSTNEVLRNQLSFGLKFKSEFGPTKLEFQPFADSDLEEYDYLILDAGSQLCPNSGGSTNQKIHAQGMRDQFISDLLSAKGQLSPRGTFVHLYLNGLYWGVYNLHERMDHRQSAAYQGGEPEEYDWVREGQVREGNSNDWDEPLPGLWDTAVEIAKGGLKPGDTWQGQPAYEQFAAIVDVANYADYLMANYYGGNTDWPQNNWMATAHARLSEDFGDVNPDGRWRFHSWDAEAVLYWGGSELAVGDGFYDRTHLTASNESNAVYFYTALRENPEWRMLFADRAHQHLFHGSLFVDPAYSSAGTPYDPAHPERNLPASIYERLGALNETAIALEYARWGNYWDAPGTYTPADWDTERKRLMEDFFPVRSNVLLAQFRNVSPRLYPLLDAPLPSPYGGHLKPNQTVSFDVAPGATVYYTLDGQDPRLEGGLVNPSATAYTGPFTLPGPTVTLRMRAFDGLEWSALESAGFAVGVQARLNEVVARNQTGLTDEVGATEDWVELVNTGASPLNIGGWGLSDDPTRPGRWRVPAGTVLPAKGRLVIYCDDDLQDGPFHANFKLNWRGETLLLTGPASDGHVVVDQVTFPTLRPDRAYARIPDGRGEWRQSALPTPDERNRLGDVHF